MCQLLFPPWPNWSYLTKFGQMVSTLKCILQVSISCFFLMVEFPISPGALEGKLFHPNFIQVLWPICLKKVTLNIIIMITLSKFKRDLFKNKREREIINIRNALFWVSLMKILSVLNHVLCMSKQQWLRHIFSSFRFRMTKRRLRKN